jgi:hypothetical protein
MSKASNQLPLMKNYKAALPIWYLYKQGSLASQKLILNDENIILGKDIKTHSIKYMPPLAYFQLLF